MDYYSDKVERISIRNDRIISLLHLKADDNNKRYGSIDDKEEKEIIQHEDLTVFLFHGSMATWRQFEDIISFFHGRCNIVAYDAYGCGDSDKPYDPLLWGNSHYTAEELTQDALEIFAAYSTSRNILIGHSFGSAVVGRIIYAVSNALALQQQMMESNDSNGSIGSQMDTQIGPSANTAQSQELPKIIASILLGTHYSSPLTRHPVFFLPVFILDSIQDMLSQQFVELAFSPATTTELKAKCKTFSQRNEMHVAKSFYSNFGWASHDEWKSLAHYPVLICQGKDDIITPAEGSMQLFHHIVTHTPKHLIADGKTSHLFEVLSDAGHQVMQEKPDELITIIRKFLSEKCSVEF